MASNRIESTPHRRYNPLTGEWVLVSPHRTQRPWSGQVEPDATSTEPEYDPNCYLCPGNTRANGEINPDYSSTYVFTNDYSALLPEVQIAEYENYNDDLFRAEPETGACRVVCYNPRHDLTIARMDADTISQVITTWIAQYNELGQQEHINYVQIFENRGLMMGCSNPHPHGQIWANKSIPTLPSLESLHQKEYLIKNDRCLLCDYVEKELALKRRIIFANDSFVTVVPYWAVWPFETMIIPKRHLGSISDMNEDEISDLARAMKSLGICYDNLFKTSFPYSMGIHQQPVDGIIHDPWHFHLHYYPPLLRSQTIKKHMVGYEMLAMPQRDITAELAAERLQEQESKHYLDEGKS